MSGFGDGFGEGFGVLAGLMEQRFNALAHLRGEDILVIAKTQIGTDPYGDPIYTETSTATKGVVEQIRTRDKQLLAGELAQADMVFRLKRSTVIAERGYELEYLSKRYKIVGSIEYHLSHITVYGERKVS